jgi:hypothetical protein
MLIPTYQTTICAEKEYSNPLSNAGDILLDSGMFGESALDEFNIVWD